MSGIYAGDGEQLSLAATFPNLRQLEREYGSVTRGLLEGGSDEPRGRPAVPLPAGWHARPRHGPRRPPGLHQARHRPCGRVAAPCRPMATATCWTSPTATRSPPGRSCSRRRRTSPAALVASLDPQLAEAHAEIPYASTAIVTLAYPSDVLSRPLDGYGYVVPRIEGSDVLACTWTSSKWPGRAPEAHALVRVYMGRFGRRDVTADSDRGIGRVGPPRDRGHACARRPAPRIARVHRWPRGMPQYVHGQPRAARP